MISRLKLRDFALGFFVILAIVLRIFYGVDLTDETQYVSQALLPIIGKGFFVNDLFIQQAIYFFYYPVVQLYVKFFSINGIVLFFRGLFVFQAFVSSILIFCFFKKKTGVRRAYYTSLSLFAFIPFSIPSISYNTVVLHFLPVVFSYLFFFESKNKILSVMVSCVASVLCFSYPPIALSLAVAMLLRLFQVRNSAEGVKQSLVLISSFIVVLGLAAFFFSINYGDSIKLALEFSSSFARTGVKEKLIYLFHQTKSVLVITGVYLLLFFLFRKRCRVTTQLTFLFVIFSIYSFARNKFFGHGIVTGGVYSLTFYMFLKNMLKGKEVTYFLFSSLVGAVVCGYFSSNGVVNSCLALVLAFALLLSVVFVREKKFVTVIVGFILATISINYSVFYREEPFIKLNSRVLSGPFKNLVTTSNRRKLLQKVETLLTRVNQSNPPLSSSVFSAFFPAAYLFGIFRAETRMLYFHDAKYTKRQFDLALSNLNPDYILFYKSFYYDTREKVFFNFCDNCSLVYEDEDFEFFFRK